MQISHPKTKRLFGCFYDAKLASYHDMWQLKGSEKMHQDENPAQDIHFLFLSL